MKREENMCFSPCQCTGIRLLWDSAFRKVLRCWRNPEGQVCHFPSLPCVPAELLGWFLSPVSQLLCGMTGYLHGRPVLQVALLQLLQTLILSSVDSLLAVFHLLPLLLVLPLLDLSHISSSHRISLLLKKIHLYLWAARKGLLVSTFFVVSNA